MSRPALSPPSPTHLGGLITRCPKVILKTVVFSRAGDTRAHPWTLALFAFTTFTEKRKIRTIFNPKLKTKTAQKISYTSTKTWEILTKTWEFFGKTWEIFSKMSDVFLEILGNPPNSTKTLRPLSHKIEGKSPISLKLPSFHLLFLSQAQKIRQSFCAKIPHFSPRFPLFNQHSLNVC